MSKIMTGELVGVRESVADELLYLSPHQIPILNRVGFGTPLNNVKHEWVEDAPFGDESTASSDATVSATTVSVQNPTPFRTGHVIKIGEELLKVTGVSGSDLTVERGYADTTAAAITAGDNVEVQFVEGVEGADARSARFKPRTRKSNLMQIFDETISISGTSAAVSQYGIDDLYEYERQKKQEELALQLEKAIINGIKYEDTDGYVRQMNGIRNMIQTNVTDASSSALTDAMLNDLMQDQFEQGAFKSAGDWKIIVPAKQKRAISGFDKADIRLTREENTRGQVVDQYVSDFGQAEIVLDNNLDANEVMIVDTNRLNVHPMTGREFTHTLLGNKGDYTEGQIVG
ncbi:SU10 major capsid protein [Salibacterium lacus]|uniref:DUF5309 family protein n=1 Tax=Salibacterium lacus TaxID=1898109 RepID=A0ABW5SZB1_9BACI